MKQEFDLSKFVLAQQRDYPLALQEIKDGEKFRHWMWYIFPQVKGLGVSPTSVKYGIESLEEARAFLAHPCLGRNLSEISQVLLTHQTNNAADIFGSLDAAKLRSSMTLFAYASGSPSVFHDVLEKYFQGIYDSRTEELLKLTAR